MRRLTEEERRWANALRGCPALWESHVRNHQHHGSRFLLPAFVATCVVGILAALMGAF